MTYYNLLYMCPVFSRKSKIIKNAITSDSLTLRWSCLIVYIAKEDPYIVISIIRRPQNAVRVPPRCHLDTSELQLPNTCSPCVNHQYVRIFMSDEESVDICWCPANSARATFCLYVDTFGASLASPLFLSSSRLFFFICTPTNTRVFPLRPRVPPL